MKRSLCLILVALVVGCSSFFNRQVIKKEEINLDLPAFHTLVVGGQNNLELINGDFKIAAVGNSGLGKQCDFKVVAGELRINCDCQAETIRVWTNNLKRLVVIDRALVSSRNFESRGTEIIVRNLGSLNLKGTWEISKLSQYGKGKVNVLWIDNRLVPIEIEGSGSGVISLAGKADYLNVRLTRHSELQAQYLRAKNVSIVTENSSVAEILPLKCLKASASDRSNILYHKRPQEIEAITSKEGVVMFFGSIH